MHYKQMETFQYANFYLHYPPSVKKEFVNGEVLHFLRTNLSHSMFNKNILIFKMAFKSRGYPDIILHKYISAVNFYWERKSSLKQRK